MKTCKILLFLFLVVSMIALPACTAGEPAAKRQEEKVTLSFMASEDWVQDAELTLARRFESETGIGVEYQIFPQRQYVNLLMTKLNTGECTDIYTTQSGSLDIHSQYRAEMNALDLTDTAWAKNVDDLAAAELSVNGRLYGQPIQDVSSVWAVAYNKNIFKELGLSIPKNYQDFLKLCAVIQDAGITPIYECLSDNWHHSLWFIESLIVQETVRPGYRELLNSNNVLFSGNNTFLTLLRQMQEMVELGYWGDHYISNTYANLPSAIVSGTYAMAVYNQGLGDEVHAVSPELGPDDIGYFVIPLGDNQSLNINPSGPSRFIYSGTSHPEEALAYLEFLASQESLDYLTREVPKYNKLPFKSAPKTYTDSIEEFYNRYPQAQVVYQTSVKYLNPQWADISNDLSQMLIGEMSAEQVLERIDQRRTAQALVVGDPHW